MSAFFSQRNFAKVTLTQTTKFDVDRWVQLTAAFKISIQEKK